MCGIAGFTFHPGSAASAPARLAAMVAALRHRGPDALRGVVGNGVALGHARLSIVDLEGGTQPMRDEATGLTVIFNGEIFNHVELRETLSAGHTFRTRSDTEVILAAFLQQGIACLDSFNGQFAFALHDPRDGSLWLARDRFGKRPLFYSESKDGLAFASEAKSLFAGGIPARLDHRAILETLHLWAPTDRRSFFAGVNALPPGCAAHLPSGGTLRVWRWWDLDLGDERVEPSLTEGRALEELEALLDDAVRLRLRADVPVAAYLSGGLDSSLTCALAQRQLGGSLRTFSVGFARERFDERDFQGRVAAALGTAHRSVPVNDAEVGESLPAVVEHAEAVLLRTAPAPLLRLSGLVRQSGIKVVLTGEGADELFLGYDLFKEVAIRRFWARRPRSTFRPALLRRLYPYLDIGRQSPALLGQFFGAGLERPDDLAFSHGLRWQSSGRVARLLSASFQGSVEGHDPAAALLEEMPPRIRRWRSMARAQYLEVRTLLSQYLLSSQGDRMLMAHSVEGRFPFLDHRLAAFASRLPEGLKLRGLREKVILRRLARGKVPPEVIDRPKFPYRAPAVEALLGASSTAWSRALFDRDAVNAVGVFDGEKVSRLRDRLSRPGVAPSESDGMAVVAVATTGLLAGAFLGKRPTLDVSGVKIQMGKDES